MEEQSRDFFYSLIRTPSPSGYEEKIQSVIKDYIRDVADEIRVDVHGNLVAAINPGAPYRDACRSLRSNRFDRQLYRR